MSKSKKKRERDKNSFKRAFQDPALMHDTSNGIQFTDIRQSWKILEGLNQCRLDEKLCDVVFVVDGRRLPAHKNILSVASEYFKAMFSHNMLENSMLEVPLVGLSYGALEQVLTYIYTGRLQVSREAIQDLLITSDMLQLDDIKQLCSNYLARNINISNAIELFEFSETYHCPCLKDKALRCILASYPGISGSEQFLQLSHLAISTIIRCDDLSLEPEGESCVVNSLLAWLERDPSSRLQHAAAIFSHIRWKAFSKQSLHQIMTHPLLTQCEELAQIICDSQNCNKALRNKKIMVVGGYLQSRTGPDCPRLCSAEMLDVVGMKWKKHPSLPLQTLPPSYTHALVIAGQLIIICLTYSDKEGKDRMCLHHVYKYNAASESWILAVIGGSTTLLFKSLEECARHHGVVTSTGGTMHIVSCRGVHRVTLGHSHDQLLSVGDVTTLPDVPGYATPDGSHRESMGVVVHTDHLYCIGGYDVQSKTEMVSTGDVYMWDSGIQTWQKKANMKIARSSMATAVLDDYIYVTGGMMDTLRLSSVEQYHAVTDTWTLIQHMEKARSCHMSVATRGSVYVMGGQAFYKNEGRKVLNVCEVYDPDKNTWSTIPHEMNEARCLAAAVVV